MVNSNFFFVGEQCNGYLVGTVRYDAGLHDTLSGGCLALASLTRCPPEISGHRASTPSPIPIPSVRPASTPLAAPAFADPLNEQSSGKSS